MSACAPIARSTCSRERGDAAVTWLAFLLLAVASVLPVLLTLRRSAPMPSRKAAALALYRAQLGELDRDLAERRIAASEHAAASLEVQRRLLAAAEVRETFPPPGQREPVVLAAAMVLAVAVCLYALHGRPELPARAPNSMPVSGGEAAEGRAQPQGMIDSADRVADAARQEHIEQGDDAQRRGDLAGAAALWRQALAIRFDPVLAVRTADAESTLEGRIGFHAATLFRRALATVPSDAPWRPMVEHRLAEAAAP